MPFARFHVAYDSFVPARNTHMVHYAIAGSTALAVEFEYQTFSPAPGMTKDLVERQFIAETISLYVPGGVVDECGVEPSVLLTRQGERRGGGEGWGGHETASWRRCHSTHRDLSSSFTAYRMAALWRCPWGQSGRSVSYSAFFRS